MKNPVYLFSGRRESWDAIARKLRAASGIALFLDYDGTLTPIRRTPSAAVLTPDVKNILQQLAQLPDVCVAIVTGRSMRDIQKLVRVDTLGFAANHGFHMDINGIDWIHPQAVSQKKVLSRLHSILCNALAAFPELYIENKQFTLSIHYRNVAAHHVRSLKALVSKTVHSFNPTLQITRGKKILEVRPQIPWGKGDAVLAMLNLSKTSQRRIPLFIGDDTTDEDVFRALRSKGITIRVGRARSTNAQYYVKSVKEVHDILRLIISLRENRSIRTRSRQKK
ncbi:MAG: trehalose-phosphatase [bacterium]